MDNPCTFVSAFNIAGVDMDIKRIITSDSLNPENTAKEIFNECLDEELSSLFNIIYEALFSGILTAM